jgi:predicted permease
MPVFGDIRYAIRVLAKSPLFAVTAVVSLALGVAASTSIFSLADALLLRPLPGIANPETVIDIGRNVRGEGFDNFGYPMFVALRERNTSLASMAAVRLEPGAMSLASGESSERVFGGLVSGNYFEVLGTQPAAGRFFLPEEDKTPGTHPVIVLNHQFWADRFQKDPNAVGTTLRLNGLPFTIVGVAQEGFTGHAIVTADFWVPFAMDAYVRGEPDRSLLANERAVWHTAIGRLKAGVTIAQAGQELDAIAKNYLRERNDDRAERWGIAAAKSERVPVPGRMPVVGFLAVLGTLTTLVLVIACSNVAGMLLARALQRRREVATRLAVGASRARIIGQLLVEGLVLALVAAAVSIPATNALVGVLQAFQPSLPVPIALELRVDPRTMGFAVALSTLTAMLFALLPALQATRFDVASALHGGTATADRRRTWLRHGLVAGQVAMALLLLVATGLFLRSLQEAASVDEGFTVENVDTVQIDTQLAGYKEPDSIRAVGELIDRFRRIDTVTAVGASRMLPLLGGGLSLGGLRVPGYRGPDGRDSIDGVDWDVVSPGYFEVLQMPLVRGRAFTDGDHQKAPMVAIINETFAQRVFGDRDPIGQQVLQRVSEKEERPLQIVAVAKNAKYRFLNEPPRAFIYVPLMQQYMSEIRFFIRRSSPESRIAAARAVLRAFDPSLPVVFAQTFEQATAVGLLPQRLAAWVAGSVGTVGLLLAALGLYGLTAFAVAQRTREIAVRMALGATRDSVLRLVLRQAARLAVIGGVIGLALAIGISLALQSLLIGIQPIDPIAFGAAALVLTGVLLAASWVPARRAANLDPMRALRAE